MPSSLSPYLHLSSAPPFVMREIGSYWSSLPACAEPNVFVVHCPDLTYLLPGFLMDCPYNNPRYTSSIHHPLQPLPIPHPSTPPSQRPLHNIITISGTGTESFLIPHGPGARRRPHLQSLNLLFYSTLPPIFHIPLSLARTSTFVSHKQHSTHLCRSFILCFSLSLARSRVCVRRRPVPSDRHPHLLIPCSPSLLLATTKPCTM